jgi:hypothetical protein
MIHNDKVALEAADRVFAFMQSGAKAKKRT